MADCRWTRFLIVAEQWAMRTELGRSVMPVSAASPARPSRRHTDAQNGVVGHAVSAGLHEFGKALLSDRDRPGWRPGGLDLPSRALRANPAEPTDESDEHARTGLRPFRLDTSGNQRLRCL